MGDSFCIQKMTSPGLMVGLCTCNTLKLTVFSPCIDASAQQSVTYGSTGRRVFQPRRFFSAEPQETLTLALSRREGAPLSCRPSAVADAGNRAPLNWCRAEAEKAARDPSDDAVAGGGDRSWPFSLAYAS